jgi:UDP-glucose 4-epimerase
MAKTAQENVIGSIRLFSEAINAGVDKIIFASSGGTVYGHSSMEPVREDRPLAPISGYGAGKAAVESYLQVLSATHGISGISLRIGNPYGPYQLIGTPIGIIANFIRRAREDRMATIFGDGEIVRDYISISDVAEAFVMGLETPMESGAYNIGSGHGKSINDILSALNPLLPTPLRVEYVAQRSFDIQSIVLNCTKFSQATGWQPKIEFQSGLEQMLASGNKF